MDDLRDPDDMLPPHDLDDIQPPAIMWDNQYHVSDDVWDGDGRESLETYCGNMQIANWKLRRSQRELLHMVGFGVFANQEVVLQNDRGRISVLVERWRPETNTFFMKQGEMTVTLEDVGYITGLPCFGQVLTCGEMDHKGDYFRDNWFEPLTDQDVKDALRRNNIKFTWLFDRYGRVKPAKDDMRAIIVHTQAYMLLVIGAVLFPTSNRSFVHPRYIRPLQNLRHIRTYAWGSAVLAHLYRALEFAAKDSKSIAGCTWLLEVWSYERFPNISVPVRDPFQDDYPVAEGWTHSTKTVGGVGVKRRQRAPHHSLAFYRAEFDGVTGDVVEWRPYARFDDVVDWDMIQFQLAGRARVSLVSYDVVEWPHPERVMRQFGARPHIPRAPTNMEHYRQPKEATFVNHDFLTRWFDDIGRWVRFCHRFEGIIDDNSVVTAVSVSEYMAWYVEVARTRMQKPQTVVQPEYSSREIGPNMETYRCYKNVHWICVHSLLL